MQADLNRKREIFDQLTERLQELEEISIDSDDDSSEGEDLLGDIIQTPSDSLGSRSAEQPTEDPWGMDEDEIEEDESTVIPEAQRLARQSVSESRSPVAQPAPAAEPTRTTGTTTTQELRSRNKAPEPETDTAETSARKQLFGNQPGASTTAVSTTATTEAILDHHREEQERLTESLLHMATALKSSSRAFATSLEEEKDVLGAAGSGLDKNESSLDAASRRMGALRKMSEGKGWLGRMLLYAWIFGLMVVAVLIVFVLPKLRF